LHWKSLSSSETTCFRKLDRRFHKQRGPA
jgi:hypothetical protein